MNLQYSVVFERTPNNYCAYVPDLPGCVSTAHSWEEIQEDIRQAIAFHLAGMRENGDTIPEPRLLVAEAAAYHIENVTLLAEWSDEAELVAVVAVAAQIYTEPAFGNGSLMTDVI